MRTPKDWGQPCPNPECVHYNRMQQGNVSAIATYLTQVASDVSFAVTPVRRSFLRPARRSFSTSARRKTKS